MTHDQTDGPASAGQHNAAAADAHNLASRATTAPAEPCCATTSNAPQWIDSLCCANHGHECSGDGSLAAGTCDTPNSAMQHVSSDREPDDAADSAAGWWACRCALQGRGTDSEHYGISGPKRHLPGTRTEAKGHDGRKRAGTQMALNSQSMCSMQGQKRKGQVGVPVLGMWQVKLCWQCTVQILSYLQAHLCPMHTDQRRHSATMRATCMGKLGQGAWTLYQQIAAWLGNRHCSLEGCRPQW